jgi:hypothetical protein
MNRMNAIIYDEKAIDIQKVHKKIFFMITFSQKGFTKLSFTIFKFVCFTEYNLNNGSELKN